MLITLKLFFNELCYRRVRTVITILAVSSAIALITWAVGTVTTTTAQHRRYLSDMTGIYDAWIIPDKPVFRKGFGFQQSESEKPPVWGVPWEIVDEISRAPQVKQVAPFAMEEIRIEFKPGGKPRRGPRPRFYVTGVDVPEECPYEMSLLEGAWLDPDADEAEVVICSAGFFRGTKPAVGEHIKIVSETGLYPAKITGVINQPSLVREMPGLFVSKKFFEEKLRTKNRPEYGIVLLDLDGDNTAAGVEEKYNAVFKDGEYPCRVEHHEHVISSLQKSVMSRFMRGAPLLLSLAVLATICIVITTLSMGVQQRIRSLAMLRAVGMSRGGIYFIVLWEALFITVVAYILGSAIGYGVIAAMVHKSPELFPSGIQLGTATPLTAGICALLGVLASALFPCIRAARLKPLDIIQQKQILPGAWPRLLIAVGFIMLLPAPVLALRLPMPASLRITLLAVLALPCVLVGCILIAPVTLCVAERVLGNILSRVMGLDPRLLRNQLTHDPFRSAGAAITLSIGLGLYIAIQTWGGSMLSPFLPSPGFPDMIVSVLPDGLTQDAFKTIQRQPGVNADQSIPIEVRQLILSDAMLEKIQENKEYDLNQNNVLILGTDVAKTFAPDNPMCAFEFSQGDPKTMAAKLQDGPNCVIAKTMADQARLNVGDQIEVLLPNPSGNEETQETALLTIAGIADVNWHLITARSHLRGQDGNTFYTLGPVFVDTALSRELCRRDDENIRFVWMNMNEEISQLPAGTIARDMTRAVKRMVRDPRLEVRASHRDDVTSGTIRHAADIINGMARIPMWSLVILSLGLLNTMFSNIQIRRFEFGIQRAVGMTRWQLARLLCIEALLIGGSACLLSLIFGIEAGWCFTGYTRGKMAFGGLPVAFNIPWALIGFAVALTLALCLIASIVPAIITARKQTTNLLKPEL